VPSRFAIDDALWAEVEPLIPVRPRRFRYPGRKPLPDRLVLNGILHVLHTRARSAGRRQARPAPRAFFEAEQALGEIREKRFYRRTHDTFEEYCRAVGPHGFPGRDSSSLRPRPLPW
jgi:transposase